MKTDGSPFAWVDGEPYLIANFTLDDSNGFPSLFQKLEDILEDHSGKDVLILRKLSTDEAQLLRKTQQDSEHEAWAQIVLD